ncbi:MAG: NUDIX domain-containing protein [Acidimicrobiia bacterium]|nr:NUDIX domain-containing protein [Acidimicrobiia bacterium]
MKNWAEETKAAGARPTGAEAHPSATVVLLRDAAETVEVLMLRRSSKMAFHGGTWVFPGGRIDAEDWAGSDDVFAAARRAAVREAAEEARLQIDPEALVHLSKWTTPEISPKRFATWFFAAAVGEGDAEADGVENDEHRWFRPDEALSVHAAGEIELAPPQYVTLLELREMTSVADALEQIAAAVSIDFAPRFHFLDDGGALCVYAEDVAWDDFALLGEQGPRHRLTMLDSGWVYERDL